MEFGHRAGYDNIPPKIRPKADEFLKTNPFKLSPEQNAFIFKELNKVYEAYRKIGEAERQKKEFEDELQLGKGNLFKKEKIVDIPWAIENWMESTGLCLIAGQSCVGKSTLAIKIAVQNAMGNAFWLSGGVGDGRKSLYICLERKKDRAFNKEIACGGDGNQIDILESITINGKEELVDLENPKHLNIILRMVKNNNYWSVIFDPIADLVLSKQNDNAEIRKAFNVIFKQTENLNTLLIGIIHLKKERGSVDEVGMIRGASELSNMANSVLRVTALKDNEGYLFHRLIVNEGKNIKKGAVKYKIEDCEIPEKFLAKGSKEKTKGGIKSLNYEDTPVALLKKECESDIPDPQKESNFEKIKRVIDRRIAEDKDLNTTKIKELAKAEGVSGYYIREKLNWRDFGYEEQSNQGFGAEYKIFLKPIK